MGRGAVVTLRHVHVFRDRLGKRRAYFRPPGQKAIPLPMPVGSPAFMTAYNIAIAGLVLTPEPEPEVIISGSISAAISAYYTDNSFLALAAATRSMRRAILERFRNDHGHRRIATLEQHHLASILGKLKPWAARNWLKTLRGFMQFAVATKLRSKDPTDGIRPAKAKAGTIHTWTEDEIEIFERHHEVGTRARLAMALMLYTAARRGDAVLLGPQHLRGGRIHYRQQKTGRQLAIPVHPLLAQVINACPSGHLTFLVTATGKPFSAAGFGNWFREMCDAADLPHCSSHGLRKAQARRLAEAGCSAHEIAAITGHKTLSEVQRYTEAAEQSRMADAAIKTVSRTHLRKPSRKGSQTAP